MLSGEDVAKILFTPSGFESPSFNATLGRWFLFEQIERHVPKHHKVLLAVILVHATGVLLKGEVEHPVEAIFDTEVGCGPRPRRLEHCPAGC